MSTETKIMSKESVAFDLALNISITESLASKDSTYRKELLDLYAECLSATDGRRSYLGKPTDARTE